MVKALKSLYREKSNWPQTICNNTFVWRIYRNEKIILPLNKKALKTNEGSIDGE